ncbi:hypothetical protein [Oricola sp.]|uniref:hypothetical protein n=1 Tax=Oricola sp. TaxID=1979950 RepID=UPI003514C4F2
MASSSLLNLLPDFSEGQSAPRRHPSGFEPLVGAALSKEEFSTLGMSVGFIGLGDATPTEDSPDPFAEAGEAEAGDLDDLADLTSDDSGLPGLQDELADVLGELEAPMPDLDFPGSPVGELEEPIPSEPGLDDIDIAAADAIAAQGALETAHKEEIERLQQEHREAMDALLDTALPRMKQEVAEAIASDLAPLMAGRIRAGMFDQTIAAMQQKIIELLDDSSVLTFELRGPEHLVSAFLDTWSGDASQVRAVAGDGVDLVARIDRTVIATRLSELDRLIEEAAA